jgi:Protein of unknown function (DUF4232)
MYSLADGRTGRLTRRTGLFVLAAGSAGLLTACGSGAPAATPAKTVIVTAPATPTASAVPSTSGPGATVPAPTAPATTGPATTGPAACPTAALRASLGQGQGTAGTFYQLIVLTNTSPSACSLYGYPGVSFVARPGGSVIGAPASRNPLLPDSFITLKPGAAASALVGVTDTGAMPRSTCKPGPAGWLQIYPPGDRGPLFVQYTASVCTRPGAKFMTITAMHAGTANSF